MKYLIFALLNMLLTLSTYAATLNHVFSNPQYHYAIAYSDAWTPHDHGDGVVVFGKSNSKVSINIQTIYTKKASGHYKDVKALMDDFVYDVPKHSEHVNFSERKPYLLSLPQGGKLAGESIMLTFVENGKEFKQWQVMFVNSDGRLFQAFAYRAPINQFATDYQNAMNMLATWNIY